MAEERCQKLLYVNSHQECQLGQARRDLEQCRRRLLDAQVQSRGDPLQQGEDDGAVAAAKGNALRAAKKELKMASCSPNLSYRVYYVSGRHLGRGACFHEQCIYFVHRVSLCV